MKQQVQWTWVLSHWVWVILTFDQGDVWYTLSIWIEVKLTVTETDCLMQQFWRTDIFENTGDE